MEYSAQFSSCRKYRYLLTRTWDKNLPQVMFICLNPSSAAEIENDRTVAKCISFVNSWRIYGGLIMTNLFAFRSTDANQIKLVKDPVGRNNDLWIREGHNDASITLAAWGNGGTHLDRSEQIRNMFKKLYYLSLNQKGEPTHPLYLPFNLKPKRLY
ncbi:MAG: DUF1643 domain-containing protein [candidate division Zixibacteria bacterium]|nr:DUF1643 domain-containing protein [candidate division Zixibacteria bacterium]